MKNTISINRVGLLFLGIVVTAIFMTLFYVTPSEAQAKTLKVGQCYSVQSYIYDETANSADFPIRGLKSTSSNKNVAYTAFTVDYYDEEEEEFYMSISVIARGFGTAKIKLSWDRLCCGYHDGEIYYDPYYGYDYHYHDYTCYRHFNKTINVKIKLAKITRSHCDFLYTGQSYSIGSLYSDLNNDFYINEGIEAKVMKKQKSGKFKSGSGYVVTNNGKKIKFTSTGKKTVKYKYNGKVRKIYISTVHSKEKLKQAMIKEIKGDLYFPTSFRLRSTKFKDGVMTMKYSSKALSGYYGVYSVKGSYSDYYNIRSEFYGIITYSDKFKYYLE